jgi:hypothetical protein
MEQPNSLSPYSILYRQRQPCHTWKFNFPELSLAISAPHFHYKLKTFFSLKSIGMASIPPTAMKQYFPQYFPQPHSLPPRA